MFKWSSFPFIRLSIALAVGIVISQLLTIDEIPIVWIGVVCFLLLVIALLTSRWIVVRGIVIMLLFTTVGFLLGELNEENRTDSHYSHFNNPAGFVGVIVSDHSDRTNHRRYELELIEIIGEDTLRRVQGKIYLYIELEGSNLLKYGDVVAVSKGYFDIAAPKNPEEFDYRTYLERQNIYAHAFVSWNEVHPVDHQRLNPILGWAYQIRTESQKVIDELIRNPREKAIISALILGIKDHLDNELKTAYSSAGAIHVLAVSGLHVGIIFILLKILFKPWKERRYGRFVFMIVATSVIWMYALITGFSPSVMRAATMFSVIIISEAFHKKANIYNSLGIAAFILIVLDPFVIYAVGFQLSFIAVFGILMVYPLLYHKWHIHNKVGNYIWSILCVSIAAQIATFPLTLYYFHQFPTYFLVSNLVVIPAATVMLYGGLLVLLLGATIPVAGQVLAFIYELIVYGVNEIVLSLKVLPYPLFDWIYFDLIDVVLIYLILLFCYQLVTCYSYHLMKISVFCIMLFSLWLVWKDWDQDHKQITLLYEIDDIAAIDIIQGSEAVLLVDTFPENLREETYFQVDPFRLANGLSKTSKSWKMIEQSELARAIGQLQVIEANGREVVLVGDMQGYELSEKLSVDIVYLKSPCAELLDYFDCQLVVLGNGLNYYEKQQMISLCESNGIDYHSLKDDGYLKL